MPDVVYRQLGKTGLRVSVPIVRPYTYELLSNPTLADRGYVVWLQVSPSTEAIASPDAGMLRRKWTVRSTSV